METRDFANQIDHMYQPADQLIWTGRTEWDTSGDPLYWHQIVQIRDISELPTESKMHRFGFLGFQSDEGVIRNRGRAGSKTGPDAIRQALSNLAIHHNIQQVDLLDLGNVTVIRDLEAGQQLLSQTVWAMLEQGCFPILIGGGHEIAYGHGKGVYDHMRSHQKGVLGVINFDAHLDLRSFEKGHHSGSPFRQLAEDCQVNEEAFYYLPVGVNPAANSKALFDQLSHYKQSYISVEETRMEHARVTDRLDQFIEQIDSLYLTLDLDVISGAWAPGVSAPAAFGLEPEVIRDLIRHCLRSGKVISFDIAEMNPVYDDGRTARLAAAFIYDLVMNLSQKT